MLLKAKERASEAIPMEKTAVSGGMFGSAGSVGTSELPQSGFVGSMDISELPQRRQPGRLSLGVVSVVAVAKLA